MKKTHLYVFMLISVVVSLSSCGSNYYVRKAAEFEKLDQHKEAAELYLTAFKSNKTNVDAYIGLKRTAQRILEDKLEEFNIAYRNRENRKSYYVYQEALKYFRNVKKHGVELNLPNYYQEYYVEAKNSFLEERYLEAINFINAEKFSDAEIALKEIIRLNKDYRDARAKLEIAINEPKYRVGVNLMEEHQYRNAYQKFKEINDTGNYKESKDLQAYCLEKGSIKLCVLGIKNKSNANIGLDVDNLRLNFITKLNNSSDPFIKLVDGNDKTQRKDRSLYFLKCELLSFYFDAGTLKEEVKKGYIREIKSVKNKRTKETEQVKSFKKVVYKECSRNTILSVKISYKLVQSITDEISYIKTEDLVVHDNVHYAHYDGKIENLFPGTWIDRNKTSSKDYVYEDVFSKGNLNRLLKAKKRIKSREDLLKELTNKIQDIVPNNIEEAIYSL